MSCSSLLLTISLSSFHSQLLTFIAAAASQLFCRSHKNRLAMDDPMKIDSYSDNNDVHGEILNRLPLDIQRYIVCHLPLEDAVKTTALSKKWKLIWHSLQTLIFDYQQFPFMDYKVDNFENFINQTLRQHDSSNVEELEISLYTPYGPYPLISSEWIRFGLDHMVKCLSLDGAMKENHRIPSSLFTSRTLICLELSIMGYILQWPKTVSLPNLTDLTLRSLVFVDENVTLDFSTSSPSLERLVVCTCDFSNAKVFAIHAPVVDDLEITWCIFESCKLVVRAPRLTHFEYDNQIANGYDFDNLSPNFNGIISFQATNPLERPTPVTNIGFCAVEFLRELSDAAFLHLNHWFIQFVVVGRHIMYTTRTLFFNNVVTMNIEVWANIHHYKMLLLILSKCPNLTFLKIEIQSRSIRIEEPELEWQDMVDFDMLNRLRYLKMVNFWGQKGQMGLLEFLLLKAAVVEEIKIKPPYMPHFFGFKVMNITEETWNVVTRRILNLPKTSPNANLTFW